MHVAIEKRQARKEDQDASHIILVEPTRVNWSNLRYVLLEWLISCYWNGGLQVGQRSFQQLNMVFTSCTSSFIHVVELHFNNSCYLNLTQWSDAPQYTIFITFVTRKHLFWVTHTMTKFWTLSLLLCLRSICFELPIRMDTTTTFATRNTCFQLPIDLNFKILPLLLWWGNICFGAPMATNIRRQPMPSWFLLCRISIDIYESIWEGQA